MFGLGGLGHLAVQIGREFGAEVTAVDISDEKLARAKSLGAAKALNNSTGDAVKEIRKAGGAHVALVCSAAKVAYDAAFNSVRPTGTLLAVGVARGKHLFSADYDGGPGSAYQGIVCWHSRGSSRRPGDGRSGQASL